MSEHRQRTVSELQLPVDYHYQPVSNTESGHNLQDASNQCQERTSCCRRSNCAAPHNSICCGHSYIIPVFILFVLVLIVLLLPWETFHHNDDKNTPVQIPLPCQLQLVETIPLGLNYTSNSPIFMSTFEAWQLLLDKAKTSVDIAAPYWTLRGVDVNDSSTREGELLFQRLLSNGGGGKPKLRIRIALNKSEESALHADARILANYGAADVVAVKLGNGGVLHTKLWIVDGEHFYVGSANMDWRSLTQVKELGVLAQNCPHLTRDLAKIFKAYWYLGGDGEQEVPSPWPWIFHTHYNLGHPMLININKNYTMRAYISSSPPPLTAAKRTHDLDAILNAINTSEEFINIAVMDYYPLVINGKTVQYWPYIDNALRVAALERGVAIRMLVSWWKHSDPSADKFLRSLQELSRVRDEVDIQIRRFVVPIVVGQRHIAFTRVSHNTYMITDRIAYIGTSNWSGEYFTYSSGIGLMLEDTGYEYNHTLRTELFDVFSRDWNSPYALPLKPNLQI